MAGSYNLCNGCLIPFKNILHTNNLLDFVSFVEKALMEEFKLDRKSLEYNLTIADFIDFIAGYKLSITAFIRNSSENVTVGKVHFTRA